MADKETLTSGREVTLNRDENGEVKNIEIPSGPEAADMVILSENELYDLVALCEDDGTE